jgi:hypothetical protein
MEGETVEMYFAAVEGSENPKDIQCIVMRFGGLAVWRFGCLAVLCTQRLSISSGFYLAAILIERCPSWSIPLV